MIGAVEIRDLSRGMLQKPKAIGSEYLDALSGRVRLQATPSDAANYLHTFIGANIRPGTTLVYDGHRSYLNLAGYRSDPRTVGRWRATSLFSGSIACLPC